MKDTLLENESHKKEEAQVAAPGGSSVPAEAGQGHAPEEMFIMLSHRDFEVAVLAVSLLCI